MSKDRPSSGPELPPIRFLGGKGGVGKTTLAAAMAVGLAESGRRTLLVSTDPAHSLADLLETPLDDEAREVAPNLFARELDPERARDRYLATVRDNIRRFTRPEFLAEAERQIELAGSHPGVMESALFEALCRVVSERGQWDRIIVDTAPTGHTLHLLSLPQSMQAWTEALLARQSEPGQSQEPDRWQQARAVLEARRELFEQTRTAFTDPATTAFLLVSHDEPLSLNEAERACETLGNAGVSIPALLINRSGADSDALRQRLQHRFPHQRIHTLPSVTPPPMGLPDLHAVTDRIMAVLDSGKP